MIDRERFTRTRHSCTEPDRSVGKEPVGELSLSGESECLSLHGPILYSSAKKQKDNRQKVPHRCPSLTKGRPISPHASMQGHPGPSR